MRLLADWIIRHMGAERKIELLQGDLSRLPPEHSVDILVVSAFQNDYLPTRTSLIGALDRQGLSIKKLSINKHADLRQQYSCWLSKPLGRSFNFRQILCIESGWRGTPPEITDDLFRALVPNLLTNFADVRVAMPLIGTGDAGYSPSEMLNSILAAAVGWIERGLPLAVLKIVIYNEDIAESLRTRFLERKKEYGLNAISHEYDIFVSYAHKNADAADVAIETLRNANNNIRIFCDRFTLRAGDSWLMTIAHALDNSKRVIAMYSPEYWSSKSCQDEFLAAFTRQNETGRKILYPLYISDADILYMFRAIQYQDCRTNGPNKIAEACSHLAEEFS